MSAPSDKARAFATFDALEDSISDCIEANNLHAAANYLLSLRELGEEWRDAWQEYPPTLGREALDDVVVWARAHEHPVAGWYPGDEDAEQLIADGGRPLGSDRSDTATNADTPLSGQRWCPRKHVCSGFDRTCGACGHVFSEVRGSDNRWRPTGGAR